MTTVRKQVIIDASPDAVWDAMRDVGALHTRLVPGFVTDTRLETPDVRVVTFFNGMIIREPIISLDDDLRRIAWTASGDNLPFTHYNSAAQVFADRILILRDHVIAHMLEHQGAIVREVEAAFDPEGGAYDNHAH